MTALLQARKILGTVRATLPLGGGQSARKTRSVLGTSYSVHPTRYILLGTSMPLRTARADRGTYRGGALVCFAHPDKFSPFSTLSTWPIRSATGLALALSEC